MQEMWVQSLDKEDALQKEMATCSNILAWKIPWTEEPGGLQSMGLQRMGHDGACMHGMYRSTANFLSFLQALSLERRRKWQLTSVFLPGEFHGQKSLVGYSPWNHKESDTTEWLTLSLEYEVHLFFKPQNSRWIIQ